MDNISRNLLNLLVRLAKSDMEFSESEKIAIKNIGARRGISESEVQEIFDNPDIKKEAVDMTLAQKINFIYNCVLIELADGKIASEEDKFVKLTAKRLGFRMDVVDFILENPDKSRDDVELEMNNYFI